MRVDNAVFVADTANTGTYFGPGYAKISYAYGYPQQVTNVIPAYIMCLSNVRFTVTDFIMLSDPLLFPIPFLLVSVVSISLSISSFRL